MEVGGFSLSVPPCLHPCIANLRCSQRNQNYIFECLNLISAYLYTTVNFEDINFVVTFTTQVAQLCTVFLASEGDRLLHPLHCSQEDLMEHTSYKDHTNPAKIWLIPLYHLKELRNHWKTHNYQVLW